MRWTTMCLHFVDPYRQVALRFVRHKSPDAPCVSGKGILGSPGLDTAHCMPLKEFHARWCTCACVDIHTAHANCSCQLLCACVRVRA